MSERSEILAAIEKLERQRSALGDATVDAAVNGLRRQLAGMAEEDFAPRDEAERKHTTVMFADLSGFTPLSGKLDPEELRSLINACFENIGGVVTRLGGYIDKFIGDEMMVLFGAPVAMEDHASRALIAAVEVREALSSFNATHPLLREQPLALHFGINSGMVVAGMVGSGSRQEYTVMGEPVNIAARLVSAAEAGQILIGEGTRRLVGEGFDLGDIGEVELKGIERGYNAWELVSVREPAYQRRPQRFAASMVGRETHMAEIEDSFQEVVADRMPQSVAIIGPAGIGKSRLYSEFNNWLADNYAEAVTLHGAAFPHMQATPYYMIGDMLRRWLGTIEEDSSAEIRVQLSRALHGIGLDDAAHSDALMRLMGIESESDSLSALEPNARKERVFDSLLEFARALSRDNPLVIGFEDLHWADDLSMELLEHLFDGLDGRPVLFLTMTRPITDPETKVREVESRIPAGRHKRVALTELDEENCARLVEALAPGFSGSPEFVSAIVQKGQGNPFFVEEIVGALRDRGVELDAPASGGAAQLEVPDTVFGLLAERIDRLPAYQKRVLQSAAVVGRVFWPAAVSELAELEPLPHLDALNRREFVHPVGQAAFGEDWEWMFRHVLLQEVAYSGLLKERRKVLHQIAARWLESRIGDRRGEYAPLLAHHYELGEEWEKTAEWAEAAGDHAAGIYAHRQARAYYTRALGALDRVDGSVPERFIDLALKLSRVSFYTATEDVHEVLRKAAQMAEELGDARRRVQVLTATASWLYMTGRARPAVETAMQALVAANAIGLESELIAPNFILGRAMYAMGDYALSADMLERADELAHKYGDNMDEITISVRAGATLAFLGMSYQFLGQREKGRALSLQSLEAAQEKGDLVRVASAHLYLGSPPALFGLVDEARYHLQESFRIAQETGELSVAYVAQATLAYVLAQQGEVEASLQQLDAAIALAAEVDSNLFVSLHKAWKAESLIRAGRLANTVQVATEAIALARETRQQGCEAEAHRVHGWALWYANGDADGALAELRTSLAGHERTGGRIMIVRVSYELAELLRAIGDEAGALEMEAKASAVGAECGATWLPIPAARPPAGS